MLTTLSPPPGINSDDTTFGAEGAWADGDNCRFENGRPQAIGGGLSQFTITSTPIVLDIFVFSRSATATVAYGGDASFFVGSGVSAPSDRTPAAPPSGTDGWSFAAWGNTLLAASRGGTLYEQSGASLATAVAPAPDRIDAGIIVTPERQVLAFGCNEEVSTTFNPLCIRGSDLEDYTDWATSATNNAFEHILESGGKIVAARMVGSYVAVWTDEGVYLGQFIGDPSQTYRFDRVDVGCGLIARNAVTTLGQTAYWIGPDLRFRQWTPGSLPSVIPCQISQAFRDNYPLGGGLNPYTFAVALHDRQEVWFFYGDTRDAGASGPTRYVAFAIQESAIAQRPVWFRGQLARSAMVESGLMAPTAAAPVPLSGNASGVVRLDDIDGQGTVPAGFIQSADQYVDNSQRRVMIRGIRPDFDRQTGDVLLTLYVRNFPMSAAVTKGPYTLTSTTVKKDFRASGKLVAVKFSWAQASSVRVRLGKPLFDTVPLGER